MRFCIDFVFHDFLRLKMDYVNFYLEFWFLFLCAFKTISIPYLER